MSLVTACSGCTAILEDNTRSESFHIAVSNERPPEEQIVASSYEELMTVLLDLITEHEQEGLISVYTYDGDVQADVDRAIDEIMNDDPVSVYAVAEIDGVATKIVTYYEIDIKIEYKRTKEQADSIITVSNLRSLRNELLSIMSEYREEAVFLVSMQVTEEDILEFVRDTYYQNPRSIVMLPVTVVTTYTTGGNERLIELSFRNIERDANVLLQYGASLAGSVRRNALAAEGENDAEILLYLVETLIGACRYDLRTARTISEHGVQNLVATAYHALVIGSAVGEGFAMAYKALCDELDLNCRVVLGHLKGMVHAWNIVTLNGENYHIDVAMCALNGVETAFFKADSSFIEDYSWDIENTVKCNGTLTYEEIIGIEEEPGEEPGEETGEEPDDETGEEPDDEQGSGPSSGPGDVPIIVTDDAAPDETEPEIEKTSEPTIEVSEEAEEALEQTGGASDVTATQIPE